VNKVSCEKCADRGYTNVPAVGTYEIENGGISLRKSLCLTHVEDVKIVRVLSGMGLLEIQTRIARANACNERY
jgi:hypothetical protein